MRKFFANIPFLVLFFFLALPVSAANLSIRLAQPKTPNNQNSIDLNFVTLDVLGRPLTVRCFKKSPGDANFVQFGTDINLLAGGNTANCPVTSSLLTSEGTYQFYVTATAESESVDSSIISVNYKNSGPGTPTNYSKEKLSCSYKINFRTADDGGKTVKVEIYRSENTSFTADSGSRVGTLDMGSNQDGSFNNSVPCDKEFYFALRAFDNAGNGSGTVGDSVTKVTTITTSTSTSEETVNNALQVASSQVAPPTNELSDNQASILGEQTKEEEPEAKSEETNQESQVKGATTENTAGKSIRSPAKIGYWLVGSGILLLLVAAYLIRKSEA